MCIVNYDVSSKLSEYNVMECWFANTITQAVQFSGESDGRTVTLGTTLTPPRKAWQEHFAIIILLYFFFTKPF